MSDPGPAPAAAAAAARTFVVNSLAARAQSVAEIERKLAARGVAPAVGDSVIDEAVRLGYLDDTELAGQLARGYRARRYGRRRADTAMRRRLLDAATVDAALDAAYDDTDESQLAREALGSRPLGDDADRRRAVAFLLRRGFSPAAAWRAVRGERDGGL
ncbi:MAG TPA: RecX family transcriptional regulator [Gaiella sp.]|nr:RecX family transcriptional regulator [Gaiella sp.]